MLQASGNHTETVVAELREQICRVANNTSVQTNNSILSDVSQVQSGQSGNNAVSEPCASNSSHEWKCLEW